VKGLPAVDDWHFIDLGDEEASPSIKRRRVKTKVSRQDAKPQRRKFRLVLAFLAALRLCAFARNLLTFPRPWRAYFEVAAGLASIAFH
jgi:hypothetical protein